MGRYFYDDSDAPHAEAGWHLRDVTDEIEALRLVAEKACAVCDYGYDYGIEEEPRRIQELQAAVDALRGGA